MIDFVPKLAESLAPTYRLDRELGGGGMSRVFLAEEPRLARRVVVKVLPPETSAGIPADRFEREIRVAASLQHPHLVPVLSAGGFSGFGVSAYETVEHKTSNTATRMPDGSSSPLRDRPGRA